MRILIESKDAGDDKGAWFTTVVHTEGIEHGLNLLRKEYRNAFLVEGEILFQRIIRKMYHQIRNGHWALGDDCMWTIEGCTFQISAIADTKH